MAPAKARVTQHNRSELFFSRLPTSIYFRRGSSTPVQLATDSTPRRLEARIVPPIRDATDEEGPQRISKSRRHGKTHNPHAFKAGRWLRLDRNLFTHIVGRGAKIGFIIIRDFNQQNQIASATILMCFLINCYEREHKMQLIK